MLIILIVSKGTLRFHKKNEEFDNDFTLRYGGAYVFSIKLQQFIEIHKDVILIKRLISK